MLCTDCYLFYICFIYYIYKNIYVVLKSGRLILGIKCGLCMFRRTTCSCHCIKFCRKYNFWVKLGGAFFNNQVHLLSWLKELLLLWPMVEEQVSLPVWSLLSWYCFHLCWPCLSCWTVWVHWHRIVFSFFPVKCEIHYVLYWINIKCMNNAGFVNEMFSLYSSSSSWELLLKGSDQYVVQAVVFVVYNLIVANYGVFNLFHGLVLLRGSPPWVIHVWYQCWR